jgi:hypothetical protein
MVDPEPKPEITDLQLADALARLGAAIEGNPKQYDRLVSLWRMKCGYTIEQIVNSKVAPDQFEMMRET